VTAAALAFSRKGNSYGVNNEDYSNLMAQSLLDMAMSTENMIQAMIEKAQEIEVETEDQIVTFDFDPSMAPTEYEERVTSGWIEFSVASDEFETVYNEVGTYA
jgi:trehalose/maltose hydrolase-like predicted phosphorylase